MKDVAAANLLSSRMLHPRLWLAGLLWAAAVATLVAAAMLQSRADANAPRTFGRDLLPSYAAGRLLLHGHADRLYDPQTVAAVEREIARANNLADLGRSGPFLNPPVYALLFVPLAALPYDVALAVWMTLNVLLLVLSLVLLCRMLPRHANGVIGWRRWGLIPLLLLASLPFWQAFHHQQNTFLSLALLCTSVTCWRSGHFASAGFAAGLLCFKPQLGAAFAAVLIVAAGWRALAGVVAAGGMLLLVNLLLLPATLGEYLNALPPIVYDLQMRQPFNWVRQVTPHAFWRLLFQGRAAGETAFAARILAGATALAFAAFLAAGVLRTGCRARQQGARCRPTPGAERSEAPDASEVARRAIVQGDMGQDPAARDRLIAAAVAAMPLVMPYFMDYDLLLLAVPAVLFAADRTRAGDDDARRLNGRWLSAVWIALYVGVAIPTFAPAPSGRLHVPVLLLAAVAAGQLWRALRPARYGVVAMPARAFPVARAA